MAENNHPSIILCPYCGHIQQLTEQKCEACGGFFDRLSLKATQVAMGPWFIQNAKKPFKPGCSYEVIKKQASAGRIHPRTIMRGPTTRQFWSFAKNVPGVAHLIGYCHNCGNHVTPTDHKCSKCNAPFREVALRNEMGLLYPSIQDAAKAQEQLDKEVNPSAHTAKSASGSHPAPAASAPSTEASPKPATGDDLLDEVIGRVEKQTGGKAAPRQSGTPLTPAKTTSPNPAQSAKPAASTPTPPAPVAPGLDLGETDDEDTQMTTPPAKPKNNTLLIALLVIGIVCVLAIQVVMFSRMDKAGSAANPGSATSSSPLDVVTQYIDSAAPQPQPRPESGSPAPRATTTAPTPPFAPSAPSSSTLPPNNPPPVTPAPPTAPAPEKKAESIQDRYRHALDLEKQKKYKESLAILEDIQKKTPLNQMPKEMFDAIRRLQSKVAQQNSAPLFENP